MGEEGPGGGLAILEVVTNRDHLWPSHPSTSPSPPTPPQRSQGQICRRKS